MSCPLCSSSIEIVESLQVKNARMLELLRRCIRCADGHEWDGLMVDIHGLLEEVDDES